MGAGSFLPDDFSISCSIRSIALLASSRRLRLASHRGDSGSAERRDKAIKIGAVPMKNIVSQPKPGNDEGSNEAGDKEAEREDALIEDDEPPPLMRLGDLADINGCNRHLAAEPYSLDRAEYEERFVVPRQSAQKAHDRHHRYCANESRQPAPTFRAVTDHQRAEQLTKVSGRDEYADLGSAEVPKRAENRQHLRNCQGIERVKEGRRADQDARLEMPWRKRQSFDTCGDGADRLSLPVVTWFDADRCGAKRCGHLTLPVSMRLPPLLGFVAAAVGAGRSAATLHPACIHSCQFGMVRQACDRLKTARELQ